MPRYALRNQQKIADKLGKNTLDNLLKILDNHFSNAKSIVMDIDDKEPHATLRIDNHEFYVIEKKYDIYRLAFKRTINTLNT